MFSRYIEQILKLFNYIDGIMIVDTDGIITYFYTSYPNINSLQAKDVLGKKLLDVYPSLTEETSVIMNVLKTGKTYLNYVQKFTSYKGQTMNTINSTIPIYCKEKIIGVADIVIYVEPQIPAKNITIDIDLDRILKNSKKNVRYNLDDIITCDERMIDIKNKIQMNENSDSPVLVYGKTGTGKELIVNALHRCNIRRNGPFISQNCAAIPSTLLESILFGTVKGSFTGAHDSPGLFEVACGGTLFLDEINSMELNAQAKLLRAIENKKIRRVGDTVSRDIDVRIIAAVNEDPLKCVSQGILREDLYYRLCVIRFDISELKDRKCDIPLLMEYFRKYYNVHMNKNIKCYSDEVKKIFMQYNWPGNVRELRNSIESAFQFNYSSVIDLDHIPQYIINSIDDEITEDLSLTELVDNYEKKIIEKNYYENNKNISKTASVLKISKQSLWYKMKKLNII